MSRFYSNELKAWILSEIESGETLSSVSERYHIHVNTLRKWLRTDKKSKIDFNGCNKELVKEFRRERYQNEILKIKTKRIFKYPKFERFEIIYRNRYSFSISKMCQWLGVSESGYYKWMKQKNT